MEEIKKLFSWKDVERIVLMNEDKWITFANRIVVYTDSMEISLKDTQYRKQMSKVLEDLFDGHYDRKNKTVLLDLCDEKISVDFDGEELPRSGKKIPLFRKILYQQSAYDDEMPKQWESDIPLIVFHSYKGGVGRTLSLLAFAKAWVSVQPKNKNKLLIVDSDIEAPGLTWLQEEGSEQHYSYLDFLEMIQSRKQEFCLDEITEQIRKSAIKISNSKEVTEQYFIPAYRYKEQLLDIYSKPENIVTNISREYIIPEVLIKIGEKLGVNAILVDLRAGLSEYSAPFLFDARVKKYFVTSTSTQSIDGIGIILEEATKGLKIQESALEPEVFLTMIPDGFEPEKRSELMSQIADYYACGEKNKEKNEDIMTNSFITELQFDRNLIHLGNLQDIMRSLGGSEEYYGRIEKLVKDKYVVLEETADQEIKDDREEVIRNIHNFAGKQVTAEGNQTFGMLITDAISNLKRKYRSEIPCAVLLGAKGSGKTFLYCEFLKRFTWQRFCMAVDTSESGQQDACFIPVFASKNSGDIADLLKNCIANASRYLTNYEINETIWLNNEEKLGDFILSSHNTREWRKFWEEFLVKSVDERLQSFAELNTGLTKRKKKLIFLIDGLEETLEETIADKSQQSAVSVLCQDIVKSIGLRYKNIGIIIFLRKDMARNSIKVNFEQFNQLYSSIELKWTREEALRLALWLVAQAQKGFYTEDTPIESALPDLVEKQLQKLWGIKLGRVSSNEAYSSRWILAALSDFNGQLQARDIVRFLEYATDTAGKPVYKDRYIMPAEIRNAVPKCSQKKIDEIKDEIKYLRPVLEKLERLDDSKKMLPFTAEKVDLSASEQALMSREGYLSVQGEKYYLPEIIRHALGFKYEKGARPKVLSLSRN